MNRWWRLALLCSLVAWTGCQGERAETQAAPQASSSGPIPDEELLLRLTVDTPEVELGQAFPLTVVRVWARTLEPRDWHDDFLAPLVARLVTTSRRENERHIEETRRYECYAFELDQVMVPPISFAAVPRGGGPDQVVQSQQLDLRVPSALSGTTGGAVELPGGLLPVPAAWRLVSWPAAAILGALVLASCFFLSRRRRRGSAAARLSLEARTSERLRRLRERLPLASDDTQPYYVEVSALMREYVEERFEVRRSGMSTEEFLLSPEVMEALLPSQRALLAEFLTACDRVKFARHSPEGAAHERACVAAEDLVQQTISHDRANAASATSEAGGRIA